MKHDKNEEITSRIQKRTRVQIIDCYLEYLHSSPPKTDTIREILPYLEVSRGTFYRYFENLSDLQSKALSLQLEKFKTILDLLSNEDIRLGTLEKMAVKLNLMKPFLHSLSTVYSEEKQKFELFLLLEKEESLLVSLKLDLFSYLFQDKDVTAEVLKAVLVQWTKQADEEVRRMKGAIA